MVVVTPCMASLRLTGGTKVPKVRLSYFENGGIK